jgi:hypothetical protein
MQSKTELTLSPTLVPSPSRTDAIVTYVVAAGFAVGGFLLSSHATGLRDDLQDDLDAGTPPPDENDDRFLRAKIFAVSGDAMYALSGISLAVAVYYTLRDKGPPSTAKSDVRAVAVSPALGPEYAGLGMGVSW